MTSNEIQGTPIDTYPDLGGNLFSSVPTAHITELPTVAGIFVCISRDLDGRQYLLDIDHADDMQAAVLNHPRFECWKRATAGPIAILVGYQITVLPPATREATVRTLRAQYQPLPCG